MAKQRISYVPLEKMDAKMRVEMERCQRGVTYTLLSFRAR